MNQRFSPRIKDCAQGGSNKNAAGARGKQWKLGPGPLAGSSSRCLFGLGWRWTRPPETDLSRSYMIVYDRIADNMQQPNKYEVSMGFNLCQPSHGSYMIWQYMTSMLWLLHVATSCLHRLYVPHGVTKAMSCDESPPGGPNSSRRRERNSCGRLRAGRFCRKLGRTWHVAGRLCQGLHLPSSPFLLYPSAVSCLLRFLGAKWYLHIPTSKDTMEI